MRRFLFPVITVVVALVIAALLGEAGLRLLAPQDLSGGWRVLSTHGYPLNKAGGTARHQFGDRVVRYRFNEQHLRGAPLPDTGTRVLVLGDSYTFGWLLNEEDTFVARIQVFADREFGAGSFVFLNGGTIGWGTADQIAFVEEFGETIDPAAVVVFMNTDDIGRSWRSGLYKLVDPTQAVFQPRHRTTMSSITSALNSSAAYQWILEHSHVVQLTRTFLRGMVSRRSTERRVLRHAYRPPLKEAPGDTVPVPTSGTDIEDARKAVELGNALFARLHAWCGQRGAALLVLTTGWNQETRSSALTDPTDLFLQQAGDFFRREGIPYHDLSPEVRSLTHGDLSAYVIYRDYHPNEEGDELIASTAWTYVLPFLSGIETTRMSSLRNPSSP
jgi:hypothetical protein